MIDQFFENERRLNDAWIRGGPKEEQEERKKIQQEKIDERNKTRKSSVLCILFLIVSVSIKYM